MTLEISSEGAQELLELLIRRGYFEEEEDTASTDAKIVPITQDDDLETFRASQKILNNEKCQTYSGSGIIEASSSSGCLYYSPKGLAVAVEKALVDFGGRSNCSNIATKCQVEADQIWKLESLLTREFSIQRLGPELVHTSYWNDLRSKIQQDLQAKGSLSMSDLASKYSLSMTVLLQNCIDQLEGANRITLNHARMLVTDAFQESLIKEIVEYFQSIEEPVTMTSASNEHGWDPDYVLDVLKSKEASGSLKGDLHVDEASTSTALYTPHIYNQKQNQELIDFVTLNGYVIAQHASRFNMPLSQMVTILKDTFPSLVSLGSKHACLVQDHILQSLQEALKEPDAAMTVDLADYLPAELIRPDFVNLCLQNIDFDKSSGVIVAVEDAAKMFSTKLVKEVKVNVLPPLIEKFAIQRAEELFQHSDPEPPATTDDLEDSTTKSKKKGKKKSKKVEERSVEIGVISILEISGAVLKEYSDIMPEDSEERLLSEADSISWDDDEQSDIFVVEFCKIIFFDDDFRSRCEKAVAVELQRLKSAKESKATISRKDAATKVRNVQSAFEECFTDSCYLIQTMSKFISLASASPLFNEEQLETLKKEFLTGPCADLTSRITQYCLFKEDSGEFFTFQDESSKIKSDAEKDGSGLPSYCEPMHIALLNYEGTYLSCPPPRDPLPILRETLPGSVGVSLARQWVLCGGETYKGGLKSGDGDDPDFVRPGDFEGVLPHLEENCL
jgi:hypothetical protein